MSTSNQVRRLEHRDSLAYHRDGIVDLIVAWMVFAIGIGELTGESFWMLAGWFPTLFLVSLKNAITVPRVGHMPFSSERSRASRRGLYTIMFVVLLLLVIGTLLMGSQPPQAVLWLKDSPLIFWALLSGIMLGVGGFATGVLRFVIYGLTSVVLMLGASALGLPTFTPFIVLSLIIFAVGSILLIRFLRTYPLRSREADDGTP